MIEIKIPVIIYVDDLSAKQSPRCDFEKQSMKSKFMM